MVHMNPPQAVWNKLVLSWCNRISDVNRRGVQESKNVDYTKQHHTAHCWFPGKVMHPANTTKCFSLLTRFTSILLMKNVQIITIMSLITNFIPSNICFNYIFSNSLQCALCLFMVGQTCAMLTMTQLKIFDNFHWCCIDCILDFFPATQLITVRN